MAADESNRYKDTLNLPRTSFPMKANLPQREPEQLKKWEKQGIYGKALAIRRGRKTWTLHDGPPYANGHIHMGTALNKILKDIVVKSKWMSGHYSHYVPGWDCHGLPIEHKVDEELATRKKGLSPLEVRCACREYAGRFIGIQREEFKRLGVFGDWENPYITMDPAYEARITREFGVFVGNGAVYRRKRPVHWCSSCTTALAEAEVEYADIASPSIYVRFPFRDDLGRKVPALAGIPSSVVIWTTTPWTIPANMAVALHPEFSYVAVRRGKEALVLAEDLAERALGEMGLGKPDILARFPGKLLEGEVALHPLYRRPSPIVMAGYVTLDAGTGAVHTAPGHGQEDYETGVRHGLPVFSPVDDQGRFTAEAESFAGLPVRKANPEVVRKLEEAGALLASSTVEHSYPHCWRCKKPIIFRATEQWFISMEARDLRKRSLEAIRRVKWIPAWGEDRIYGMIESRPDWCISRQRVWGSPITIFWCEGCGAPLMDKGICDHVAGLMEKGGGADIWYEARAEDLLPPGTSCPGCGGRSFRKDMNILDVWFDSGVSHAAVLEDRNDLTWPADMYLEGSDQHRGWFHSSLLASVGTHGRPPFREVLTHGYVVDGAGRKMSKSLGNVISPLEVVKTSGAEIVRLWTASADYWDDIRISDEILQRLSDAYRRIRNTCRYLLGNLYDFDPAKDAVPHGSMEELDRWILHRLGQVVRQVRAAYERHEFHVVYRALYDFCVVDLSNFYLDVLKDRMYTSTAKGRSRRSGQTAFFQILSAATRLMAPVLSFTAEEVWENMPGEKTESVFLADFPEPAPGWEDPALDERYQKLLALRELGTRALEAARQTKLIGNSLEASLLFYTENEELSSFLLSFDRRLADLFIVSSTSLMDCIPTATAVADPKLALGVEVIRADGGRCDRCWKYAPEVEKGSPVCRRCQDALEGK